ncbi:hypothetical protein CPC08DRAFT_819882 [Agrocybe pediades]|nr:hypothetical protein CPC08DRAFT_819882 [Agrocybe pediades]
MPLNIINLPQDLLLIVCTHLDPKDLLSFIQTCRVLHAYGSTDYVWHQIKNMPPLDNEDNLMDLSAAEIKRSVIRALRLDDNWKRPVSKIMQIYKLSTKSITAVEMQPLGPNYLVTSHRVAGSSTMVSVWRMESYTASSSSLPGLVASSCIIAFEPEGRAFSFHAALQGKNTALIIVLGSTAPPSDRGQMTIYRINLDSSLELTTPLLNQWKIRHTGVIFYADICGPIVGAAVFNPSETPSRHQVLLFNTNTNVIIRLDAPRAFDGGHMRFKIYSGKIVFAGVSGKVVKVCVCKLPQTILSATPVPLLLEENAIPSETWEPMLTEYETKWIAHMSMAMSYSMASDPFDKMPPKYITLMTMHTAFSRMEDGVVNLYHFPIDDRFPPGQRFTAWMPTHTFDIPPDVTLENVSVGKTGCRAVWLSHQWSTDDYQLMKGSFSVRGDVLGHKLISPLQPPELALPFQAHTCRSLYFENNTGRLFVGIHTGEIYILQF